MFQKAQGTKHSTFRLLMVWELVAIHVAGRACVTIIKEEEEASIGLYLLKLAEARGRVPAYSVREMK